MKRVVLFLLFIGLVGLTHATEFECEHKYCKEMISCDEAYFQLQVCGDTALDRDGDGVPCEKICGKKGGKQSKQSKQKIKALLAEQEKQNAEQEQN